MESLTNEQKQEFKFTKIYHICENPFRIDVFKHRDHCHSTGKYCGAAHQD